MAKILVVDDEKSIISALRRMLGPKGHEVIGAENGAEALDIILNKETTIDLVLTDVNMPIMDGPMFIRALRASGDMTTPVVIMSGALLNLEDEVRTLSENNIVQGFLAKPWRMAELNELVCELLG